LARVRSAATTRAACQEAADLAQLHRRDRLLVAACLTLVTLECTPVDIAMSVTAAKGAVYSPRVLRLGGHGAVRFDSRAQSDQHVRDGPVG
jgi:hypothetical protein